MLVVEVVVGLLCTGCGILLPHQPFDQLPPHDDHHPSLDPPPVVFPSIMLRLTFFVSSAGSKSGVSDPIVAVKFLDQSVVALSQIDTGKYTVPRFHKFRVSFVAVVLVGVGDTD